MIRFSGRQTQFYIDVVYGLAFSLGFGYLLVFGMDPRVAALEGGLVLGYFLRVWENMSVYERILEEEVAQEAEDAVAEEVEAQVPSEAESHVAEEIEAQVPSEAEDAVAEEVEDRVPDEVDAELEETIENRVREAIDVQLAARLEEFDEELASDVDANPDGEAST